jgi:hypothetical protein
MKTVSGANFNIIYAFYTFIITKIHEYRFHMLFPLFQLIHLLERRTAQSQTEGLDSV